MKSKWVFGSLLLGLGVTLALTGLFTLTGRAAPGNPVLDPAPNTHTAPTTTTVSITYDEDIDAATVTSCTFAVHGMQGGLVVATHGVSGSVITVDPACPFHPGEMVQVSATTGTLNLGGEGPALPTVWQFRAAVQGGIGRFFDSGQRMGSSDGAGVALGDLDGDGDLDAFVANSGTGQANAVWQNDGTGRFTETQSLGDSDSIAVVLGDLDSDGDLDAFVANYDGQGDKVWRNDGTGVFTEAQSLGSSNSVAAALGDLDGDGDLDAFVGNYNYPSGQPNKVWLNQGGVQGGTPGVFADSGQTLGTGNSHGVALEDVDGDGDLDAFVANVYDNVSGSYANRVWLNDGTGVFTETQSLGGSISVAVALGDLDGDGDLDAFIVNTEGSNRIWLNDGAGTFSDSGQTLGGYQTYSWQVALGDVDADGDLDAFVARYSDHANIVWVNDGTGGFAETPGIGSSNSRGVALGDIDGNGSLDAFVVNQWAQPNRVWLNPIREMFLPLVSRNF